MLIGQSVEHPPKINRQPLRNGSYNLLVVGAFATVQRDLVGYKGVGSTGGRVVLGSQVAVGKKLEGHYRPLVIRVLYGVQAETEVVIPGQENVAHLGKVRGHWGPPQPSPNPTRIS